MVSCGCFQNAAARRVRIAWRVFGVAANRRAAIAWTIFTAWPAISFAGHIRFRRRCSPRNAHPSISPRCSLPRCSRSAPIPVSTQPASPPSSPSIAPPSAMCSSDWKPKAGSSASPARTIDASKLVHLAPEGARLLRQVIPAVHRVQERLLAPLAPSDRATMIRLLGELADLHNEVTPAPLRVAAPR